MCSVVEMVNFFLKCAIFRKKSNGPHTCPMHPPPPHITSKTEPSFYLFEDVYD